MALGRGPKIGGSGDAPRKEGRVRSFMRKLPLRMLLGGILLMPGDNPVKVKPWENNCDKTVLVERGETRMSLRGFLSQPRENVEKVVWPSGVSHPFASLQPTFDDGPHENDLRLVETLEAFSFGSNPVFYYNGANFFNAETSAALGLDSDDPEDFHIAAGGWMIWIHHEAAKAEGDDLVEVLRGFMEPEKMKIAQEVLASGMLVGFHGMTHAEKGSGHHMSDLDREAFEDELAFFELLMRAATGKEDYSVEHARPPYGAGMSDWVDGDFIEVCEERGIDLRNWAFSSNDWLVGEVDGEAMFAKTLRVIKEGKTPDILYHSAHQNGSMRGGFGEMLDSFSGHVLSLLDEERAEEVAGYKVLLEAILEEGGMPVGKLQNSEIAVGTPHQVAVDSAYNMRLNTQYMGALQVATRNAKDKRGLDSSFEADGYMGSGTVNEVRDLLADRMSEVSGFEMGASLKDANSFLGSDLQQRLEDESGVSFDSYPTLDGLMEAGVTFPNRGLQSKQIAWDIVCRGGVDEVFLRSYHPFGLHIDPGMIEFYVQMDGFLVRQGLDLNTRARIMAIVLLETGVKNELDRFGIGKGTAEWMGDKLYRVFGGTDTVPGWLRNVGMKKQADTIQYGLGSYGAGQPNMAITWQMFEVILGRDLSRDEVEKILDTPEGAAFSTYLSLRQYEVRMLSEEW